MLPNWLYGKSLKKLQEIFSDGSTPPDYNQVKAQVNQNTEDIALLDTSNQALTNQSNSIVNVLGAKNFVDVEDFTLSKSNARIKNINRGDFKGEIPNKDVILSFVVSNSTLTVEGASFDAYDINNTRIANVQFKEDGQYSTRFNGTDFRNFYIFISSVDADSAACTISNIMIRPASITDGTYAPYAMTNQKLTEKLTSDTNLGTAVNLSTYTAYSNMFTAPSDGYVHFVSAVSGSTARTIYTYGNNTTAATDPHFTHSTSVNNKAFEIFIKKGLKVYIDGLQSGDTINFYTLTEL